MAITTNAAPPIHRTWAQQNWMWVIPVSGVVLSAISAVVVYAMMAFMTSPFRNHETYITAVARARANPKVIGELGEPIEAGWFCTGMILNKGLSRTASVEFSTPLKGPHGRGTLYVNATQPADRWQYSVLEVAIEGNHERIKLLSDRDGV